MCLTSRSFLGLPVESALFPAQFPDLPSQPWYIWRELESLVGMCLLWITLMWSTRQLQLPSTLLLAASSTNLALKDSVSSFIPIGLGPNRDLPLRFLIDLSFKAHISCMWTRIITSWSDIPGMVSIDLTKEGLLVQNRSRMASSRVHSRCNWCSSPSPRIFINLLHSPFFLQSLVGAEIIPIYVPGIKVASNNKGRFRDVLSNIS